MTAVDPSPVSALSADDLLSAFDNAPIGMAVVSPKGIVTACNTAMGALLRRAPADLVGTTFFEVTHADDLEAAQANCARMQDGRTHVSRHECRFVRADGGTVWVSVSTSRVPESPARPAHLIMHIEDVTERKDLEAELQHRALHDPLTGLANRDLLLARLGEALRCRGRHMRPSHLFYLDLDGFKSVNDGHGHAAGDAVLVQFADRIDLLLGPDDTAARLGGDEFAVLRVDVDPEEADRTGAALQAAAAAPFDLDGRTVVLSVAIGQVAVRPGSAAGDAGSHLREADLRMYAGKQHRPRR